MALNVGDRLGPYEIVAPLGAGGMGVVYKARDIRLDRSVAIKILNAAVVADISHKRRFAQEAKAASALNHPGIITIYDIANHAGTDFIAMEYVHGRTLDQLIGRRRLTLKDTLNYAIPAAQALAKAHAAGIVHRDLKPSNIMVADDGVVKILDFGLAKLTTPEEAEGQRDDSPTKTVTVNPAFTEAGHILGTAAYMSPEQAEGKRVDQRSDIFSFGAVLYEMVTGTRAFHGDSSVSTLSAVLTKDPKPPTELVKEIPRDLERVILRCLRKDPSKRFQVMADLVVELEEIRTDSTSEQSKAQSPARPSRWITLGAVIISLLAAAGWLLWPRESGLPESRIIPLTSYAGEETDPTLSPDGSQVAFSWNGENRENFDIYVVAVGSDVPLRLTTDPADEVAPSWSPDGSQIAFARYKDKDRAKGAGIYIISPLGGGERKLLDVASPPLQMSWSPDSKYLVADVSLSKRVAHDLLGGADDIVRISARSGEIRSLMSTTESQGRYRFPAISPRGDYLAYAFGVGQAGIASEVYIVELGADCAPKAQPRRVIEHLPYLDGLTWTPDSTSLIYVTGLPRQLWRRPISGGKPEHLLMGLAVIRPTVSRTGNRLAYVRVDDNSDLWKFQPGAQPTTYCSSNSPDYDPQFSPDGTRIAFGSARAGDGAIWVANTDCTNPIRLTQESGTPGSPRWSPDSQRIAYDAQAEDGRSRIFVIDAAGGQSRRLTNNTDDEAIPSWSRDGKWIYFRSLRTGTAEIWRSPANGGEAIQITHSGGSAPWESWDGTTLYYVKINVAWQQLFAVPRQGGPERRVLDSVYAWDYFPVKGGIYYVVRTKSPSSFELRFLDDTTGQTTILNRYESGMAAGLTVSPDGKTIVRTGMRTPGNSDLMLIENFR